MIQPGEIYMADFGPAGPHPVIVMSREELNRGRYALVVVVPQHVSPPAAS